jgi:hypothetical protein
LNVLPNRKNRPFGPTIEVNVVLFRRTLVELHVGDSPLQEVAHLSLVEVSQFTGVNLYRYAVSHDGTSIPLSAE